MKRTDIKRIITDCLNELSFEDTVLLLTSAGNGTYCGQRLHSYELVEYMTDCYEAIAEDEDSLRHLFKLEMKQILDELREDIDKEELL